MTNSSQILNWDSNFFSKKIASINISSYDEEFIIQNLNLYKSKDFDLVYLFINGNSVLPTSILESFNCKLVDSKLVYSMDISKDTSIDEPLDIYDFTGEPSELYDLGIQAGNESRYKLDVNFSKNDFERLYKTWIDNSCNNQLADKVLVYNVRNNNLGFMTLKKKANDMSIILIATDQNHRGNGIGKRLFSYAKKYSKESNCQTLDVATQKHNNVACKFYEKCGMTMSSQTNIYHIWLEKPPK